MQCVHIERRKEENNKSESTRKEEREKEREREMERWRERAKRSNFLLISSHLSLASWTRTISTEREREKRVSLLPLIPHSLSLSLTHLPFSSCSAAASSIAACNVMSYSFHL